MNLRKGYIYLIVIILIYTYTASCYQISYGAEEEEPQKSKIMVSLGDSYSSGEGIEPFFGQDKRLSKKVKDDDWIAHRSTKSWPGLLTLPGIEGAMVDHKDDTWFFKAASGATTKEIEKEFTKIYFKDVPHLGKRKLDPQVKIFEDLDDNSVSYVTITMGGNDVDFSGIIRKCMIQGLPFTNKNKLTDKFHKTWEEFRSADGTRIKLTNVYKAIQKAAGQQAHIIVAGYPQLLSDETAESKTYHCFNQNEIDLVNCNVSKFNLNLKKIVNFCRGEGLDIWFVPVEDAFEGHEAYSPDPYITPIIIANEQDINKILFISAYSMHPNENGAIAYASCVQKQIDAIENGEIPEEEDFQSLEDILDQKIKEIEERHIPSLLEKLQNMIDQWLLTKCSSC